MAAETDGRHYTYRTLSLIIDIGGCMYRTVFTTEAEKTSGTVQAFLKHYRSSIENFKHGSSSSRNRKVISDKQFSVMFPNNSAASSADGFDVTLLAFLLMNICPSFCGNTEWKKKLDQLQPNDLSDVADLVRIREYRNKVMHEVSNTKTAFTENTFNDLWNDITEVIYRLQSTYNVSNLNDLIEEIRNGPLDNKREEELQNKIEQFKTELQRWEEMDHEMMKSIAQGISDIYDKLNANVSDMSLVRKKYENEKKRRFVETNAFKAAKRKLLEKKIVILKGNAGEGKTTVAKMLLYYLDNRERVWNVSSYKDWREIDLQDHDVVIIDDIFGTCVFDLDESRNWRNTFNEMVSLAEDRQVSIIITCRSYIMNEALDKTYYPLLKQEENVQTLELEKEEMKEILKKHLEVAGKEKTEEEIEKCLKYFNIHTESVLPIGFPECVRLFCSNKNLFAKGPIFFQEPYRYICDNIRMFFGTDADITFSAFFLLWAEKQLKVRDLEQPLKVIPKITNILDKLQLQTYNLSKIRQSLRNHRNDFVYFDKDIGVYTFKHRIIADVVGILSYEINPTAVFECCDCDFAMKYLTTETKKIDNACVVEPYQFDQLSLCLIGLLEVQDGKIEGSPLEHVAFANSKFCNMFIVESDAHGDILSAPVHVEDGTNPKNLFLENGIEIRSTEFRLASYSIWKKKGMTDIADKWFLYIMHRTDNSHDGQNGETQHGKTAASCQERCTTCLESVDTCAKMYRGPCEDVFNAELYLSVMLAIKYDNFILLEHLFRFEARVTDDMIILALIQLPKISDKILQYLCKKCEDRKNIEHSTRLVRYKNKNPLIHLILKRREHVEHAEQVVIALIKCGIQYGYVNEDDKSTVLHFACEKGRTDIARSILKHFEELDIKDKNGYYPIHYATRNGHLDTVKAILSYDKDQADKTLTADEKWLNGATLLHIAVDKEHTDMFKYLMEIKKFPVDKLQRTPFMFALINNKQKSLVKFVQMENLDKDILEIADKLLENERVNFDGMTTMQIEYDYNQYIVVIYIQEEICQRYYLDQIRSL